MLFNKAASFIAGLHDLEQKLSEGVDTGNLTPLQHHLLRVLYYDHPKTLGALSDCMNMNMPNTSREIKKLVQINLVVKTHSLKDKRIIELSLSSDGKQKVERVLFQMRRRFFETSGHWSEERSRQLLDSIEIIEKELF